MDFYPDFDDELTPSQQKNISKIIVECKIDRTHLILIFCTTCRDSVCKNAGRIGTMYQYLLPRLSGMDPLRASKGELECVDQVKQR
jgi:GTP-binding protein HflX